VSVQSLKVFKSSFAVIIARSPTRAWMFNFFSFSIFQPNNTKRSEVNNQHSNSFPLFLLLN
jgi:hypothetical protein